jgi:tetratricopeptide (TPR) repeat protein
MRIGRVALSIAVTVGAGARALAAAEGAAELRPAELYRAGQRDEAVAALAGRSEEDRKRELEALRRLVKASDPAADALLRASLLLHTDRALAERRQPRPGGRCGVTEEEAFARSVAQILGTRPDAEAFARRWLTAMALRSLWELCLVDVRSWSQEGLRRHPRDPVLLLASGMAEETAAAFGRTMNIAQLVEMRSAAVERSRIDRDLGEARRRFAEALAADPEQHEARLRLGWTLFLQGRLDEGRAELERVVGTAQDPGLVYLAHLFLARVHDRGGRTSDAERAYRAALVADPAGQAAAFGLAQLLGRADGDAGRDVLLQALARAPRTGRRDAYMSYHLGIANRGERELAALRAEVAP